MPVARLRSHIAHHRFAWVLWLALLLPFAQLAASWHEMSHAEFGAKAERDSPALAHLSHCDLCLTAAAIAGGAPLTEAAPIALALSNDEPPQSATITAWIAAPARAYRSRAPPFASS